MATASETEEFFDAPDVLKSKIKKLAQLIKESNHCVIFTGAGISTSAGIRDFRSGINTVLKTGGSFDLLYFTLYISHSRVQI